MDMTLDRFSDDAARERGAYLLSLVSESANNMGQTNACPNCQSTDFTIQIDPEWPVGTRWTLNDGLIEDTVKATIRVCNRCLVKERIDDDTQTEPEDHL